MLRTRLRGLSAFLQNLAGLSEEQFRDVFRASPIQRAKYAGFLRNVAIAMGNSGQTKFRKPLEKLAAFPNELVAEHTRWALGRLGGHASLVHSETIKTPELS